MNWTRESKAYSQIIKHVSHVAAVVQSISIGAFSFRNFALTLQNISKVTPCCQEEKEVFRQSINPITHDIISGHQEVPWGEKNLHKTFWRRKIYFISTRTFHQTRRLNTIKVLKTTEAIIMSQSWYTYTVHHKAKNNVILNHTQRLHALSNFTRGLTALKLLYT